MRYWGSGGDVCSSCTTAGGGGKHVGGKHVVFALQLGVGEVCSSCATAGGMYVVLGGEKYVVLVLQLGVGGGGSM